MSRRALLLAGILALLWAIPGTANSVTLDQLLDMPIERLLRLEITSTHRPEVAAPWPPSRDAVRGTEHCDAA